MHSCNPAPEFIDRLTEWYLCNSMSDVLVIAVVSNLRLNHLTIGAHSFCIGSRGHKRQWLNKTKQKLTDTGQRVGLVIYHLSSITRSTVVGILLYPWPLFVIPDSLSDYLFVAQALG